MADNWIQSFAVALGFDVDTSSLNTAKKSIADYEAAVKAAEKRIEDARWAGAKTEEEIAKLTRETALKEAKQALADAQATEKAEKEQAQKRQDRHREFVASMGKVALAATAMATAISYAVNRVTQSFDHLGFVSARTGASVQSLNSLQYAFKQVGGTAEQAIGFVESFAKAIRENSGVKGFVAGLGVDMTKDAGDQALDTVRRLQTHGYDAGSREAALAGISEENYALLTKYIDQIDRYRDEYNKLTASLGVNSKEASEASMAFQRSLTRLQATASALGDKLMVTLAPALKSIVDRFQDWIRSNPEKVERVMNDISKALVWVAEKIAAMVESFTGNNGDEFLKRWDDIVTRTERFAGAVERSTLAIERLLKMTGLLNREAVPGMGSLVTSYRDWVHRKFGNDADAPGVVVTPGAKPGPVEDKRTWYERNAPTFMGGKPDPNAPAAERGGIRRRGDRNAEAIGRLNPRAAEGPGRYRPEYKLGEADLSQRTADIIAGEAIRNNPESIDAVINNMLNRVGSKGWGPSGNLLEVATAPGQYEAAWKGAKASPSETEFIRSRIKAIASGGLLDNTNGSNAYRASTYRGPWYQKHADAPVVGGNRYAYEPGAPNGPYAPYATPKDVPPPKPADATSFPVRVSPPSVEKQPSPTSPDRAAQSSIHVTAPKIEVQGGTSSAAPVINVPGLPRMMQMPDFDPMSHMQPAPSAAYSVTNNGGNTSKAIHQTFHSQTTIHEARNVREAGRMMEGVFDRMHGLALENAQSATV